MTKDFWKNLPKPIIGLSPMDGYTDSAYRHVCKLVNPEIIVYTEFTSAEGLNFGAERLKGRFSFHADEQPIIAQIFGKNEKAFAGAAKYCQQQGFSGVDINMGCPSKKVVKSEHGVALRKNPDLAYRLVEAVSKATTLPVSVKTRLGWDSAEDLIDFGKGVERAGANAIAIHGRTYTVPYNCDADFEPIYELKKNVSIPVLGNGGITSIKDGMQKLGNLDGFLIGRASFGNPWVFSTQKKPDLRQRIPLIKKHAKFLIEAKGEKLGTLEIRKHLVMYVKGFPFCSDYRQRLVSVTSLAEIYAILDEIAKLDVSAKVLS